MKTCNTITQLWEEHKNNLQAFVCSKMPGNDACHDILHDVFLKLTEKEERMKWVEKPASYIIKMAQNAIIDFYRLQRQTPQALLQQTLPEVENETDIQLADCCLMAFIKALPPKYSEALILSELESLSQKALAERLNLSYTGAKSRVQRARKMLKEAILACCPYQFDKYGNIIGCCG